jgi:hypothetical protein
MSDVQRQIRVFLPHEYFVMWERVGPWYRVTSVTDHTRETERRWFFTYKRAARWFDTICRFANFVTIPYR